MKIGYEMWDGNRVECFVWADDETTAGKAVVLDRFRQLDDQVRASLCRADCIELNIRSDLTPPLDRLEELAFVYGVEGRCLTRS